MPNRYYNKLVCKLWLVSKLVVIDDIKLIIMLHLVNVEKHRTFKAPLVKELLDHVHLDIDGYPIYVNKDGIVFQHTSKIPVTLLKSKIYHLANTIKYHNNIIYNYNYYRDDCFFIINMIKSLINNIISIKPIKTIYRGVFHSDIFYDYIIICC